MCGFCFLVFDRQYQRNRLPGKTRPQNDLLCVEWDVKLCTLTHFLNSRLMMSELAEWSPVKSTSDVGSWTVVDKFSLIFDV